MNKHKGRSPMEAALNDLIRTIEAIEAKTQIVANRTLDEAEALAVEAAQNAVFVVDADPGVGMFVVVSVKCKDGVAGRVRSRMSDDTAKMVADSIGQVTRHLSIWARVKCAFRALTGR